MTVDEFRRRNPPTDHPDISSTDSDAVASSFRDSAAGDCPIEDLDKTEMNRFLEWLEGTLLIDDFEEGGA